MGELSSPHGELLQVDQPLRFDRDAVVHGKVQAVDGREPCSDQEAGRQVHQKKVSSRAGWVADADAVAPLLEKLLANAEVAAAWSGSAAAAHAASATTLHVRPANASAGESPRCRGCCTWLHRPPDGVSPAADERIELNRRARGAPPANILVNGHPVGRRLFLRPVLLRHPRHALHHQLPPDLLALLALPIDAAVAVLVHCGLLSSAHHADSLPAVPPQLELRSRCHGARQLTRNLVEDAHHRNLVAPQGAGGPHAQNQLAHHRDGNHADEGQQLDLLNDCQLVPKLGELGRERGVDHVSDVSSGVVEHKSGAGVGLREAALGELSERLQRLLARLQGVEEAH
mmetsp:Transcript_12702/g.48697  ORF Transcript_12702/g.48697 Transcript_12702/m.48697 type:complete len:343 (+) Transcript_12702:1642-2670(+)